MGQVDDKKRRNLPKTLVIQKRTIALVLIVLCIKGISAARKKPRNEVTGYSLGSFFLSLIGITMILQEEPHMSSSDFYGLLAAILIPGTLAFILPLVLAKPYSNEADKK